MRRLIIAALAAALVVSSGPITAFAAAPATPMNPDLLTACDSAKTYDASTSGSTRLVVGNSTTQIYVCGFVIFAGGTGNVKLVYGTGGTCGSGTTNITPAFQLTAQTGVVDHTPVYGGLVAVPKSNDLCINVSAGVAVEAIIYYTQF